MADLKIMFGCLFEQLEFIANAKNLNASVSMRVSHARISHILYEQLFFLPPFDMSLQHKCQQLL